MWPSMTFEVILYFIKYLSLYIDSIHVNFHQNWFINKCAREKLANIPQSHSPVVLWDVEELTLLTVIDWNI